MVYCATSWCFKRARRPDSDFCYSECCAKCTVLGGAAVPQAPSTGLESGSSAVFRRTRPADRIRVWSQFPAATPIGGPAGALAIFFAHRHAHRKPRGRGSSRIFFHAATPIGGPAGALAIFFCLEALHASGARGSSPETNKVTEHLEVSSGTYTDLHLLLKNEKMRHVKIPQNNIKFQNLWNFKVAPTTKIPQKSPDAPR